MTEPETEAGLRAWLRNRLARRADPPRHQATGPFSKGPRAYAVCPYCSIAARQLDPRAHLRGVPKQRLRAHLAAVHGIDPRRAAAVEP